MYSQKLLLLSLLLLPPIAALGASADDRVQLYGLIRSDFIYDDSRPDASQTPTFILSESGRSADQASYTMHPRLSRFGLNFTGPSLEAVGDARVSAKLEFDFQNGGRESRALPRYRHAYLTLSWSTLSLLVGQTSDLAAPLVPSANGDTLMWNAGNLGDRRAQLRLTYQPESQGLQWNVSAAIGLGGAVDQQDMDADGIGDGEAAAVPNLQARSGLSYPLGTRRISLGLWTYVARQEVSAPIAGETRFDGDAVGIDFEMPLGPRAIVRGEVWQGSNLSDIRGGIGQSVNRITGKAIASQGGWLELGGDVLPGHSAFLGYTIDEPDEQDVPAGGRTKNSTAYLANRLALGKALVIGIDLIRWRTEYRGLPEGDDNRVNAYLVYNF